MRNLFIVATLVFILSACSSKENVYERTIANHVQTDRHGTWTDLKFKVISLETSECTVADSVKILISEAAKTKEKAIAQETKWLNNHKAGLERNRLRRYPSPSSEKMYMELIDKAEQTLDSLKRINPEKVTRYEGMNGGKVLAIYATCKYGVTIPASSSFKVRTDTFVLTPDGKTVIGKDNRKNKETE